MQKYKIKVSWNWIFDDIIAENLSEAKQEARLLASERMDNDNLELSEYREPMDWYNQAKEEAKDIVEEMSEIIREAVEKYKAEKHKAEKDKTEKDAEEIANDIYNDLYQDQDLSYKASMQADGYFICNNHDELKNAIDCIDRLSEWEEDDRGLWEGKTEYWDIINIKATFTLANAILHFMEEEIKERITNLLNV